MARPPAQKQKKPAASASLTPFYLVIGAIALVGIGILVYQTFGRGTPATEPVDVEIDPAELARTPGISIGRADAPVVMYEFADFQCGGCASFAGFIAPLIKDRLVDRGIVRYVYYDFPLPFHNHAFLASRAARCANDQGQFWAYHDVLYARQARWAAMRDVTSYFVEIATDIGLDRSAFESCLRSDRHAEEVTRNLRLGQSLGVEATPTIFINGRRLPGVPQYAELEQMVLNEAGMETPASETPAAAESPGT